jgi:hypothetical protein
LLLRHLGDGSAAFTRARPLLSLYRPYIRISYRHLRSGCGGSRHRCPALPPSQRGNGRRCLGCGSLGGAGMGFAWMAEVGRRGFGMFDFRTDLDFGTDLDEEGRPRSDGTAGQRPSHPQASKQAARRGRHAQPRSSRPRLGGLGVAGIYPRARTPSDRARSDRTRRDRARADRAPGDQARRAPGSRGAHAASRNGAMRG